MPQCTRLPNTLHLLAALGVLCVRDFTCRGEQIAAGNAAREFCPVTATAFDPFSCSGWWRQPVERRARQAEALTDDLEASSTDSDRLTTPACGRYEMRVHR